MKSQKFGKQFSAFFRHALQMAETAETDAIVVMVDGPTDWQKLKSRAGEHLLLIGADDPEAVKGAAEFDLPTIVLQSGDASIQEQVSQVLIEAVADELLPTNSSALVVYSGFENGKIDSLSFVRLHEHLGRFTSRDLQQIETTVPLDTLKTVVDLAVDIGREGRESKKVGTMFVVGDTRKVLAQSHEACWDPTRGYNRKDRNLHDGASREAVKEIAQLDGSFIISPDGTVEASCRIIDTHPVEFTITPGLGSRHWAAAGISKNTKAVAVVVSESSGTVRIFQNGEIILRIEPFRRPMKWKDFEFQSADADNSEGNGDDESP